MHSTIEREVSNFSEVLFPSQLTTTIQLARKKPKQPYTVKEVATHDILDWKANGRNIFGFGAQRVRKTDTGDDINWSTFKGAKVDKSSLGKIYVKTKSHYEEYLEVTLGQGRRQTAEEVQHLPHPNLAYGPGCTQKPKLSASKMQTSWILPEETIQSLPTRTKSDFTIIFHIEHACY